MTEDYRVSQSKVKTWRRCHAAYDYKYVQKLRKKRKSRPLQFGTMIHEMLELHCNGLDPFSYLDGLRSDVEAMKLFKQERDEFGDILEDVEDIMTDYFNHYDDDEDLVFVRKRKRQAEHHFEIELFPGVIWNGKIDNLVITPNKLRWLGEHKSFKRRPSDDDRWRSLQGATYIRANDILGWEPLDGLLWDYVKSKPPAIPHILQDGSMSQKKLDTLPAKIRRVAKERGEKANEYPQLMASAEKNMGEYFFRVHAPVQPQVVDMVFEDFEATVKEMVKGHGKCSDMNIDMHCSWCDYEPLCRAKLQGLDIDFTKEREYRDGTKTKSDYKEPDPAIIHRASFEDVQKFGKQRK